MTAVPPATEGSPLYGTTTFDMTQPLDIRWQQRFANFRKALAHWQERINAD